MKNRNGPDGAIRKKRRPLFLTRAAGKPYRGNSIPSNLPPFRALMPSRAYRARKARMSISAFRMSDAIPPIWPSHDGISNTDARPPALFNSSTNCRTL
jgi:hypothetical protein